MFSYVDAIERMKVGVRCREDQRRVYLVLLLQFDNVW